MFVVGTFRDYYRPQTKFAKVMLLHLFVSHSVHKGGGMHGRGACVVRGACMAGGVHGRAPMPPLPTDTTRYGQ